MSAVGPEPAVEPVASAAAMSGSRVARGIAIAAVGNLAIPLAAVATTPILARSLGVEDRGHLASVIAPLMLMTAVATLGLPEAVTYWVARAPETARRAVRTAAWLLLAAGASSCLLVIGLADFFTTDRAGIAGLLVLVSLTLVPTAVLGALRGAASGLHRWGTVAAERYVTASAQLALIVALAATGELTIWTAALVLAATPILGALAYVRLRLPPPPPDGTGRRVDGSRLLGFGMRVWLGSLSGILLSRVDQALMAPLSTPQQLGLYAAAVGVSDAILLANSAVRDVTFSSDAADSSDERLLLSARLSFFVGLVMAALLVGSLPLWLTALFGDDFAGAVPVAALLVLAAAAGIPGSVAGAGLGARGRPELRSISLCIAAAVNIALVVLLVPDFGAMGAAVATLVGNVLAGNLNIWLLHRRDGLPFWRFYLCTPSDVRVGVEAARRFVEQRRSSRKELQP